jgi:hypothetical protein
LEKNNYSADRPEMNFRAGMRRLFGTFYFLRAKIKPGGKPEDGSGKKKGQGTGIKVIRRRPGIKVLYDLVSYVTFFYMMQMTFNDSPANVFPGN